LIGGLIERFDFTSVQLGAWSMAETLAYATSMFLIAPRVATVSPRYLLMGAGLLVTGAQLWSTV
jgi:sugar phosphate permease